MSSELVDRSAGVKSAAGLSVAEYSIVTALLLIGILAFQFELLRSIQNYYEEHSTALDFTDKRPAVRVNTP